MIMKRNRKYNLFGWLAVSTLLLTTACAGVADLDGAQTDIKGSNTVTLTVQSQTQMGSMRGAKEDPLTKNVTISRGDKADVLIFAVYKEENGEYKVDKKFAKGNQSKYKELSLADNQTAIDVESYPIKLQFVFDDDTKYKVAFWAQNGETKAYDTKDLQSVQVNYEEAKNNDELRDAFCAVSPELSSSTKLADPVTLRRPLAQVNVGSTGWDYEGAAYLKPSNTSYTQSTITLHGVAQYYDILKGEAIVNEDHPETSVTFSDDIIPAFINVEGEQWDTLSYKPFDNEEFLKVHVNTDAKDEYVPYVGWKEFDNYRLDDTKVSDDEKSNKEKYEDGVYPSTEVFKYLSMCYVLVPENTSTGNEKQLNSVLSSVEFKFKGITADEDGDFNFGEKNESAEYLDQTFVVKNVPVQKNYRTNILGNAFFTASPKFYIDIVPEYMGNFNYDGEVFGDPSEGDSWPMKGGYCYYAAAFKNGGIENSYTNDNNKKVEDYFSGTISTGANNSRYGTGVYISETVKKTLNFNNGGVKLNSTASIKFKTDSLATLIVVHSEKTQVGQQDVKCNGGFRLVNIETNDTICHHLEEAVNNPSGCSGVWVHTVKNLAPGNYEILNDKLDKLPEGQKFPYENGLFYIEVKHQRDIDPDTQEPNGDFDDHDYYDNSKTSD